MNSHEACLVLELTITASPEEVKAAYRRLAKKHHPDIDKSSGAQSKFQKISAAYSLLKDAKPQAAQRASSRPQQASPPRSPPSRYTQSYKIFEMVRHSADSHTIHHPDDHTPANTVVVLMWRDKEHRVYLEERRLLPFSITVNPPGILLRFRQAGKYD